MPTYEYACSSCNHEWEAEQSIKESPLTDCPQCQKATARRQISRGTGFILKGSGWYSDLYASSSNKKPEGASDASSGTGTASSSDKGSSDKGSGDKGGGGDKGSSSSGSSGDGGGSSSGSSGSSSGSSSPTPASSAAA